MEDIRSVLSQFNLKKKKSETQKSESRPSEIASFSEIPDVFFDKVLGRFKLTRNEIIVLMTLYRQTWCRPNLYKSHGIGPLNSYTELASNIQITTDELSHCLRSLENYGFIETVRSGQYFVRKYFTVELDQQYGQDYDQFF
jgi:DNA-binding MarR family transcriptional regulator